MVNPHDHPTALQDVQDSIYREKILRARSMSPDERWAAGFELTNAVFERMLEGAMWKLGTKDVSEGWQEVRSQLDRLRKVHEHGLYVTARSGADER